MGRLPRPGGRRATARSGSGPATCTTPRPTSRGSSRRRRWIDAERGDRRRRGRRARRRRPARLRPAPGAARRRRARRASSTRRSTCSTSTGGRCSTSRSRTASACCKSVLKDAPARPLRGPRRGRRPGLLRGRREPAARGRHRQAPPLALRAGPPVDGLAQAQDPARAGARGRWLDAGGGTSAATSGRWPSACTRTASCGSPARSAPGSTARRARPAAASGSRRSTTDDPPFDPPPPRDYRGRWGGELRDVTLGPAGARHPRRARRLVARRDGPPGRVQGPRGRPRPDATVTRERAVATTTAVREAEAAQPGADAREGPRPMPGHRRARQPRTRHASGRRRTTGDPDAPVGRHRRRAGRPRRARQGRRLAGRRQRAQADQPRQAAVRGRPAGHQARAHPLLRPDRARRCCRTSPTGRSTCSGSRTAPARPGFWQKDIPETAPTWLTRWHETGVDGREDRDANDHLSPTASATLCWLGNQASFEIHAWTGRLPEPWQPTFAYIDIDPGEKTTWDETLVLARLYRTALGHLGVRGYPKTTGKRGIQIWIPIVPQLRRSTRRAPGSSGSRGRSGRPCPDLVSWEWAKGARKGRARLDYTQNASIKTLVAPYAVRPAPGAPVSAPIAWDELDDPDAATRPLDDPDDRRARGRASATCSPPPRPTPRSCRRV